jgi:hypothetical protein
VLSDDGESEDKKKKRNGRNPGPDTKKEREALLASVRHDLEQFYATELVDATDDLFDLV